MIRIYNKVFLIMSINGRTLKWLKTQAKRQAKKKKSKKKINYKKQKQLHLKPQVL